MAATLKTKKNKKQKKNFFTFLPNFSYSFTNNKDLDSSHFLLNTPPVFNKTAPTTRQILEFEFLLLCYLTSGFLAVLYKASV